MGQARPLDLVTVTGSSALLFLIQPVVAKALLPRFGGSAGVWIACMLFFQVVLLAGYFYSYALTRFLQPKAQAAVHLILLTASLALLPLRLRTDWPMQSTHPVLAILGTLALSAGFPYFLLSTTSPLLQAWQAARGISFPYRLFAVSNAASLASLLSYPITIEPYLTTGRQLLYWSIAYAVVVVLLGAESLRSGGKARDLALSAGPPADYREGLLWVALAACASTLWLAVANHLSHEVAAVPFLWILPLGLYLLSFILCFQDDRWYTPALYRWLLPAAWALVCWRVARPGSIGGLAGEVAIFSCALFVCCMFCHGELAASRPDAKSGLTRFYLLVALGGAAGGLFVGVAAPALFSGFLELPIGITASVLLALSQLFGFPARRLARLALFAALAFVFATRYRAASDVIEVRNFYGTLRVLNVGEGDTAARALYSGSTLHGLQFLDPARRNMAVTYYGPQSGVARALTALPAGGTRRVGLIGLGAGSLAVYGRKGDQFRFYEINPADIDIARRDFTFLSDSEASVSVVEGDGRLAMQQEEPASFDAIVVDAFSDDAIPVHLLSAEAFRNYFQHLRAPGLLILHITNRYLNLEPVLARAAAALQKHVLIVRNAANPARQIRAADWAVMGGPEAPLGALSNWGEAPAPGAVQLWTDEFSNLFQVVR